MLFRINLLMLGLFSSLAWAQECHTTPGWEAMSAHEIKLEKAGKISSLSVSIADDALERAAGYQWICETTANKTAVLFVFPHAVLGAFHMRNVYIPLDIYFFDDAGKQVDAMVMRPEPPGQDIKPGSYRPAAAFRYVLEIARPQDHDLQSTPLPMRLILDSLSD